MTGVCQQIRLRLRTESTESTRHGEAYIIPQSPRSAIDLANNDKDVAQVEKSLRTGELVQQSQNSTAIIWQRRLMMCF